MPSRPDGAGRAHLVLDGRRRQIAVSLLGEALRIEPENAAPRLHPLRRIDRVSLTAGVSIASEAIAACAAHGCLVAVNDPRGRLRALLVPVERRRTALGEALDRFAARRDWAERLEDWRRARLSRLARPLAADPAAAARMGWAPAEHLIAAAAAPAASRAASRRLVRAARSWAMALVGRVLADAGCPARWMGAAGDPARNLVPLFGQIALWRLARLTALGPARRRFAAALRRDLAAGSGPAGPALHAVAALAERPLRGALRGEARLFHGWLLDMIHPFAGRVPQEGDLTWPG